MLNLLVVFAVSFFAPARAFFWLAFLTSFLPLNEYHFLPIFCVTWIVTDFAATLSLIEPLIFLTLAALPLGLVTLTTGAVLSAGLTTGLAVTFRPTVAM